MTHAPIDTRDDIELEARERIAFWAIAQHADDEVPCCFSECYRDAHWRHTCPGCNAVRFFCVPNIHENNPGMPRVEHLVERGGCGQVFTRAEWQACYLPM